MGRYRSFSGTLVDPEKQPQPQPYRDDDDDDDDARPSHGLLRTRSRAPTYAYQLPRRRFGRYFTGAITATLVLFMLYLVRSSYVNQAALRAGTHKRPAPPPPAWEQFPFLKRYHGGIRTLVGRGENVPEYPVDEEEEVERIEEGRVGEMERRDAFPQSERFDPFSAQAVENASSQHDLPSPCYLVEETKLQVPSLLVYKGVPSGFPDPVMGSYEALGLRDDVCFERYGRLGPYGYGYSEKYGGSGAGLDGEREGAEAVWGDALEIDYTKVNWADAQERCIQKNARLFATQPKEGVHHFQKKPAAPTEDAFDERSLHDDSTPDAKFNRTVVLIRTWVGYEYDAEDLFYLRALVNELSLQSGSAYVVHFLVHVKDDDESIWSDEATYEQVLSSALPAEFAGMGTLWSERQMSLIYGGLPDTHFRELGVHGVYRSTFLPVQYFAHQHPEYAHVWHWEMDVRYTGHFGHLFEQVAAWAKQQPRKGLWERNARFYVPAAHGSWDDFRHMVRVQMEHGTANKQNVYAKLPGADATGSRVETPVWGPLPPTGENDRTIDSSADPQPPTSYDKDHYAWGVGEEADLITFSPLFDPDHTDWLLADDITGYNSTTTTPRRAAIITAGRLSRRLLETMHRETALAHHSMFSEMWPGSVALHHGYKAVYAPHPVYIDRAWPTSYLAAVLNNGAHGAAGGARTSVFGEDRQHNFRGTTWYYNAGFAPNLWKRWLGYKVDNDGGGEWEEANEGRMCLPAMLLHPVKQVDLVVEREEVDVLEEAVVEEAMAEAEVKL